MRAIAPNNGGSTACANWLLSKTGIFSECPGNPRFELQSNNVPHG